MGKALDGGETHVVFGNFLSRQLIGWGFKNGRPMATIKFLTDVFDAVTWGSLECPGNLCVDK